MRLNDLTGKTFGRLTVRFRTLDSNSGRTQWVCLCSCGNELAVHGSALTTGHTKSCGCLRKDTTFHRNIKHNESHVGKVSKEYRIWISMKKRCSNPKDRAFRYYGARGILVCDRWKDSFENFLLDMGRKPKNLSLDRINNNGNYEPNNCRWATWSEQNRNRNLNRRFVNYVTNNCNC